MCKCIDTAIVIDTGIVNAQRIVYKQTFCYLGRNQKKRRIPIRALCVKQTVGVCMNPDKNGLLCVLCEIERERRKATPGIPHPY